MLIINADDLGRSQATTDAILSCHEKRRITSTSAMVFMEDSERAAKLALDSGIDAGLHLNLSERFTGANVPARLRQSHDRIVRALKANKYALLFYRPWLRDHFRFVFDAQQNEFARLFGKAPSHIDGHQHMHLATNVLIQRLLPDGTRVRRSFSFQPGEKGFVNRCYRATVDRALARRHQLTDYFFSLAHYLGADRLRKIVDLARGANVELMTHPANADEYRFLMSESYSEATRTVPMGTYAALPAR